MMTNPLADDDEIEQLVAAIGADAEDDVAAVDRLIDRYPQDPRLRFLKGSILAGRGEAIPAHEEMSCAVELAPDFTLARYQLGFFELTSGEADRALQTWGPILRLDKQQYLRRFVDGMAHLIRDEFAEAIAEFEAGVALNQENLPMNNDIRLLTRQLEN